MNREQAQTVALQALIYLTGDEAVLQRFQALSGVDAADLRARAEDPAMLAGVLDFFLGNEAQLLDMCREMDLPAEAPAQARHCLLDGRFEEWG